MKWSLALLLLAACEESAPVDAATAACPVTCDDGDACTDDRCDATTFACVHVPRDVENACRQDGHCDDGDGCTLDSCGVDAQCGWQRCQHVTVADCRACSNGFECDDGDGCTTEDCNLETLMCEYTDEPGCEPRCSSWGATTPSDTRVGPASVRGRPYPRDGIACDEGCSCERELALLDGAAQLRLSGVDASCAVDSCEQTFDCEPFAPSSRFYVFYGVGLDAEPHAAMPPPDGSDRDGDGVPDIPIAPLAEWLQVEGYCLSLDGGVFGVWDATLVLDAASQAMTFVVASQGDFDEVTLSGSSRIDGLFRNNRPDGSTLELVFQLDGATLFARVHPGPDRLAGDVFDPSQVEVEEGAPRDPEVPTEPRKMKRVGRLTLVLRP